MMTVIAEFFTFAFIKGKQTLEYAGGPFILKANHENMASIGRAVFAYRNFNGQTGVMGIEPVAMSRQDREDFNV